MAINLVPSPDTWLENTSWAVVPYPFTISCWFQTNDIANTTTIFSQGIVAGSGFDTVLIRGGDANDPLSVSTGGTNEAQQTQILADTWHHAMGVWDTADRRSILDGNRTDNTTSVSQPAGIDTLYWGAIARSGSQLDLDGRLAECAIWNRILTVHENLLLKGGYSPELIPDGLIHYWRLVDTDDLKDRVGDADLTVNAGETISNFPHPPNIIYKTLPPPPFIKLPARFSVAEKVLPGRKPVGPVKIDWESPLAKGLVFCALPELNSIDLITGIPAIQNSGSINVVKNTGMHLFQPANDDYQYYSQRLQDQLVNDVTIVVLNCITSMEFFGACLVIPFVNDSSWSNPFQSLGFTADNSGDNEGRLVFNDDGIVVITVDSDTNQFWVPDGTCHQYVVTRLRDDVRFYRDGIFFDIGTTSETGDMFWGDDAPIILGNRNHLTLAQGLIGVFKQALIYNRVLNESDIAALHADPYQFLIPTP